MSYRVNRKTMSSLYLVGEHVCKVFLEPIAEYEPGFWRWNVGLAVGKSRRQINDWYWCRKNKRARSLNAHLTGKSGVKTISRGFKEILRLRWQIQPGDCLTVGCTSAEPEKQFRAWCYWPKHYPDWVIDPVQHEFAWYRPPYPNDTVWRDFKVIGRTPSNPLGKVDADVYFSAFSLLPKDQHKPQSRIQTVDLCTQALEN